MNISKTTDELKKKIIQLKMMQLRVQQQLHDDNKSYHSREDHLDFLTEIAMMQNTQTNSDNSAEADSDVSLIEKVSEVDSCLEETQTKIEDPPQHTLIDSNDLKVKMDGFYKDFEDIQNLEWKMKKQRSDGKLLLNISRQSSSSSQKSEGQISMKKGKNNNRPSTFKKLSSEDLIKSSFHSSKFSKSPEMRIDEKKY